MIRMRNPEFIPEYFKTYIFQSGFNNCYRLTQHLFIYIWLRCFINVLTYLLTVQKEWREPLLIFSTFV